MVIAEGKSILDQVAYGRLRFLRHRPQDIAEFSQRTREEESARFHKAQRRAVLELAAFYDQAAHQVGIEIASIFAVHAMLLEDRDFVDTIQTMIREKGTTAEFAVRAAGEGFASTFAKMDSPYMQARAADIRDIARRVVRLLLGARPQEPLREGPAILVADEFLPSEVMGLNHRRLLGLISREGSVDSHTALLLRAYRVPAMAEVDLDPCWDGHLALLDGFDHRVYLDPEQELLESLRIRYQAGGKPAEHPAEEPLPV
ncbi:phosphoenolpyruvate-utilizing N-terminal domain-containing protein [Pseudoflavonifractor phocaeensis]|uniref:phosphoenolpyruvate-utilizing N-terminal domain-containing protein n=1 Tax=Pseudoflavonifractor phocaeensis TaxID=1870988 RepID=UPI001F2170E4|nr:phosphoenolpyruvate-utilizing N-terminal domain-containing protein [Pseudoflavonifractor phocaeensis]MCF2595337.1 hypothetical protein [Pseudoflavonifractor phocaeensis]